MERKDLELRDSGVILTSDHKYWFGSKQLKGITGVISRHLFPDKYKDVDKEILSKAARNGTKVHENIQVYDMFGEANGVEAELYAKLKDEKRFEIIDSEYIVTDFENFATPIDKVMRFPDTPDGYVDLGDVKNTSKLDMEYLSWQLSIDKYLFKFVNPDIKINKLYAIWTKKGVSLHEVEEIPEEEVIELLNCEVAGTIYKKNNVLVTQDETIVTAAKQLYNILAEIKRLEDEKEAFKKELDDVFELNNVDKIESDYYIISRVKGYERDYLDSKKLAEDHPDIYLKYKTKKETSPQIRIKLKK